MDKSEIIMITIIAIISDGEKEGDDDDENDDN